MKKTDSTFLALLELYWKVSNNCNFASGHAIHFILLPNPRFLAMGNHLRPYLGAADQPGGQELGGRAVGGQEVLREVRF